MAPPTTGRARRLRPALMAGALLAGLGSLPAQADPAAIVAKLKGSTASLFDLSLARLEAEVNGDGNGRGFDAFVKYQDGDIVIFASSAKAPVTEKACHGIVDAIRLAGGVDPRTGHPDNPASGYAALFAYPEVGQAAVDEAYTESVDSMFVIQVTLGSAGDGKAITCRGRLLSSDVTYQRG